MALLKTLLLALGLASQVLAKKSIRALQVEKELQQFMESSGKQEIKLGVQADATPTVYAQTVSLPVDHFGKLLDVNFTNRYWVVDAYYEPGGPVMAFDTGESNGGDGYLGYMTSNTSFFNQYLQQFKALGIVWEHRYYGESTPFPISRNTTSEQMQYLTAENALEDFVVFANQFQWANFSEVDFSPSKTPWVSVGGSYPGMRAAMLRYLYPGTVYASYAASPPIEARIDMSVYFEQVYRGMVQYGLENCTVNVRSALEYIDSQLDDPETAAAIKIRFLGRTADQNSNEGFADTLQFPFFNWQSSGVDSTLQTFCDALEFGANKSDPSAKKTGELLAMRWADWPQYIKLVQTLEEIGFCEGPASDNSIIPDCQLDTQFTDQLSISWTWQYCTEWGFFQSANLGPHTLGSRYETLEHQQGICYRQFPDGLSSGFLPEKPEVDRMNNLTDGWFMRPSNTFFTEGQFDPWRTLSPLSNEPFSENFTVTQEIPACGVPTDDDTIFGYLLPNAQHCYDFHPVSSDPKAGPPTELFAQALTEWLKCFGSI